ncbi:hypothetical protein HRbin36_00416 [bacterium HR36]|nr:hypothetical protein HRbin36_00416 [bacterium HR36]
MEPLANIILIHRPFSLQGFVAQFPAEDIGNSKLRSVIHLALRLARGNGYTLLGYALANLSYFLT